MSILAPFVSVGAVVLVGGLVQDVVDDFCWLSHVALLSMVRSSARRVVSVLVIQGPSVVSFELLWFCFWRGQCAASPAHPL